MGLELKKRRFCGSGSGVWGHGGLPHSLVTACRVLGRARQEYRRGEGTVGPITGMF